MTSEQSSNINDSPKTLNNEFDVHKLWGIAWLLKWATWEVASKIHSILEPLWKSTKETLSGFLKKYGSVIEN